MKTCAAILLLLSMILVACGAPSSGELPELGRDEQAASPVRPPVPNPGPAIGSIDTSTRCRERVLVCDVNTDCGCLSAPTCSYVSCVHGPKGGLCTVGLLPQGAPCGGIPTMSCNGLGACTDPPPLGCDVPNPSPATEGCPTCDDDNPCTQDVCEGGGCHHYFYGAGTDCGAGKICQTGWCCIH